MKWFACYRVLQLEGFNDALPMEFTFKKVEPVNE